MTAQRHRSTVYVGANRAALTWPYVFVLNNDRRTLARLNMVTGALTTASISIGNDLAVNTDSVYVATGTTITRFSSALGLLVEASLAGAIAVAADDSLVIAATNAGGIVTMDPTTLAVGATMFLAAGVVRRIVVVDGTAWALLSTGALQELVISGGAIHLGATIAEPQLYGVRSLVNRDGDVVGVGWDRMGQGSIVTTDLVDLTVTVDRALSPQVVLASDGVNTGTALGPSAISEMPWFLPIELVGCGPTSFYALSAERGELWVSTDAENDALLQEDGFFLEQESGDLILLES